MNTLQALNATATEMAVAFNSTGERANWRARVVGSRRFPLVQFTSRANMVEVKYSPSRKEFSVYFNRANCDWGDYLAGAYRSLVGITAGLKAGGLDFSTAIADDTCLRLEYDPKAKTVTIHLAKHGDAWQEAEPETLNAVESTEKISLDPS
jgi:hypothetical protein